MALQDTLRERIQPHLTPDERVEQVFLAQTGPCPWWILIVTPLLLAPFWRARIVAVTNHGIRVLRASIWTPAKPKELLYSLPPQTIEPLTGLWSKRRLGEELVWVSRRFGRAVEATHGASPLDAARTAI